MNDNYSFVTPQINCPQDFNYYWMNDLFTFLASSKSQNWVNMIQILIGIAQLLSPVAVAKFLKELLVSV